MRPPSGPRCWWSTGASSARRPGGGGYFGSSFACEAGLALLHAGAPPLGVIGALRAALDRGAHAIGVRRSRGLYELLEDRFAVGDRKRRVLAQRFDHLVDMALELCIRQHALHQAHGRGLVGLVAPPEQHDLAGARMADRLHQALMALDVVGEAELRRRDAELRGGPAVAHVAGE